MVRSVYSLGYLMPICKYENGFCIILIQKWYCSPSPSIYMVFCPLFLWMDVYLISNWYLFEWYEMGVRGGSLLFFSSYFYCNKRVWCIWLFCVADGCLFILYTVIWISLLFFSFWSMLDNFWLQFLRHGYGSWKGVASSWFGLAPRCNCAVWVFN